MRDKVHDGRAKVKREAISAHSRLGRFFEAIRNLVI